MKTVSRRAQAGSRRNKKHKKVGSFKTDGRNSSPKHYVSTVPTTFSHPMEAFVGVVRSPVRNDTK